jgi:hypothetical protein
MNEKLAVFGFSTLLCLVQLAAAVPWLVLVDARAMRAFARRPLNWLIVLVGLAVAGGVLAAFVEIVQDPTSLLLWAVFMAPRYMRN